MRIDSLVKAIQAYAVDCENAELNYAVAVEYWKIRQTASALSYYLRCAERTDNKDLAYECMIRVAQCFELQGRRHSSVRACFKHAICIQPTRPEAYFLLSRFNELNGHHVDSYMLAEIGLSTLSSTPHAPLRGDVGYQGECGLVFEKATSGWWWGKNDQSRSLYKQIAEKWGDALKPEFAKVVGQHYTLIGNSVPVMGVLVVNGTNWLKRMIDSIDYPVDELIIFNNNGRGQLDDELNEIVKLPHKFVKKFKISHLPANVGCGGGWNLIIKSKITAPYWIIASHDIEFSPGFIEEMVNKAKKPEVGMVHCSPGGDGFGSFECFLIKDWVVQSHGLFDENFYPAYVEDYDYLMRIFAKPFERDYVTLPFLHGDKAYAESGSQTWRTEPELKSAIDNARIINESEYMLAKWGPDWRSGRGYKFPFNNPAYPVSYTNYDLSFVKKKHLGF